MMDFYIKSLLLRNTTKRGKNITKDELTPLVENFIIEKCLPKIDPRLPKHINNSRGHLFTEECPTLSCNQKILFAQLYNMLAELDGKETNLSVGQVSSGRYQKRPQIYQLPRPNLSSGFRQQQRRSFQQSFRPSFRPRFLGPSRPSMTTTMMTGDGTAEAEALEAGLFCWKRKQKQLSQTASASRYYIY